MFDESTLLNRGKRILLLPGFLGLDAPAVFTLWLILFSKSTGHTVPFVVFAAAFLAIWSIYLLDRLADVVLCKNWGAATDRLRFGSKYRLFLGITLAISTGIGTAIAIQGHLPPAVLWRGAAVALGVAIYFGIFVVPPFFRRSKFYGKEFGVGLAFAGGVCAAIGFHREYTPALVMFGAAATFNCLLIAARDSAADSKNDSGGASHWWMKLQRDLLPGGWFLSAAATGGIFVFPDQGSIWASLGASFVLMTLLNRFSKRLPGADVRACADFCLLTPIVTIWFV